MERERTNIRDKLLRQIDNAKFNAKIVDVSNIRDDGSGARLMFKPRNDRSKFIQIEEFPLISNNYGSYKWVIDILGEDNQYLADYFLIVQELKKGDIIYIKDIVETNFPAFASNKNVYDLSMEILGNEYDYLDKYYDLTVAIRTDNYDDVIDALDQISLFDHNNKAYNIAVQLGNQEYINLIKDEMIKRHWLEGQVLKEMFGENTPYMEINRYNRNL